MVCQATPAEIIQSKSQEEDVLSELDRERRRVTTRRVRRQPARSNLIIPDAIQPPVPPMFPSCTPVAGNVPPIKPSFRSLVNRVSLATMKFASTDVVEEVLHAHEVSSQERAEGENTKGAGERSLDHITKGGDQIPNSLVHITKL
eukprot:sb/3473969/